MGDGRFSDLLAEAGAAISIRRKERSIFGRMRFFVLFRQCLLGLINSTKKVALSDVACGEEKFLVKLGNNLWRMTRGALSSRVNLPTEASKNPIRSKKQADLLEATQRDECGCQQAIANPLFRSGSRGAF